MREIDENPVLRQSVAIAPPPVHHPYIDLPTRRREAEQRTRMGRPDARPAGVADIGAIGEMRGFERVLPRYPLLDAIGWYCGNSEQRTHPVGEKAPSGFGLHDMAGNVLEWCEDVFDEAFYARPEATMKDPLATAGSDRRVNRGGSWDYFARFCRSANRRGIRPSDRESILGFRPAFYPLP